MANPIKINLPDGLPPVYQKALTENSKLVEQLFFGSDAYPYTESERLYHLLHFIDMLIEVFNHSAKQLASPTTRRRINTAVALKDETPMIRECITKYREFFRRHFRGVHYLSLAKLEEISHGAVHDILISSREITLGRQSKDEDILKRLLVLEGHWIAQINGERRTEDLSGIKAEAVEKFRSNVLHLFPYLYSEDRSVDGYMTYCDESVFAWELKGLLTDSKFGFKEQIPFREQEDPQVILDLCSELEAELEDGVIKDLKFRYVAMQTKVKSCNTSIVAARVESYKETMMAFFEGQNGAQLDVEKIYQEHQKLAEEYKPKFVSREDGMETEVSWKEHRIRCRYGESQFLETVWHMYASSTYQVFQKLVKDTNGNALRQLEMCEMRSREETRNYLRRITEIWGTFGLESFSTGFESHVVGAGLQSMFSHLKETNRASSNALMEASRPENKAESLEMQNYMEAYVQWFVGFVRHSQLKYVADANLENCEFLGTVLGECQQAAKSHVSGMIQWECLLSRHSRLEPVFHEKLDRFVGSFVSKVKENAKLFLQEIFRKYEHVPFKPVIGTDTMMMNGAATQINTAHHCMTEMPEYCDKSIEELQLEYRQHCRAISTNIMKGMPVPATCPELEVDFQRNLEI